MTEATDLILRLGDPEATTALARALAPALAGGDTVLLSGGLGAGKTHFARALIQTLQAGHGQVEDVPSPSFTLAQIYHAGELNIWHCDLYRLSGAGDLIELGLDAAFDEALCLIEWPDRLGRDTPRRYLLLSFGMEEIPDARSLAVRLCGDGWDVARRALTDWQAADAA